MPCTTFRTPSGGTAIACGRTKRRLCSRGCGRPGDRLCDFEVRPGQTCDKSLCQSCAVRKGRDVDWCPGHEVKA